MADREPNFSRMSRKKGKKDRLLNILIGIVVVLILVVSATFLFGNNDEEAKDDVKDEASSEEAHEDESKQDDPVIEQEPGDDPAESTPGELSEPEEEGKIVNEAVEQDDSADSQSLTVIPSDDQNVKESVVNPDWKPIGTKQTGEHVSRYDGESDDWYEKKEAISYATGIPENDLIYWRIQNGGSPQKSEGIVSDKSKDKKFKVYLEWVDGEGWKPVKMDVLNSLETK